MHPTGTGAQVGVWLFSIGVLFVIPHLLWTCSLLHACMSDSWLSGPSWEVTELMSSRPFSVSAHGCHHEFNRSGSMLLQDLVQPLRSFGRIAWHIIYIGTHKSVHN